MPKKTPKTKVCTKCGKRKKLEKFSPHKHTKWGVRPDCKLCVNARGVARNATPEGKKKHQEDARRWRKEHKGENYWWVYRIKDKYGMTPEDYYKLLASQDGGCAICGVKPKKAKLNIDHDHKTGKVRGLLCHMCNRGLPFYRDKPARLHAAAEYLASTPASKVL